MKPTPVPVKKRDHAQEAHLYRRALAGDKAAIDALVKYLEPVLLQSAHHVLRRYRPQAGRTDVEDLVQIAWEALLAQDWRILRTWDPQRQVLLRTYVGLVATRRMISAIRPELDPKESPTDELFQSAALVERLGARTEARGFLAFLVTELSERLTSLAQEVMKVMYFEDTNIEETAEKLNLTVSAVRSHKKRIRKVAHEILEEQP